MNFNFYLLIVLFKRIQLSMYFKSNFILIVLTEIHCFTPLSSLHHLSPRPLCAATNIIISIRTKYVWKKNNELEFEFQTKPTQDFTESKQCWLQTRKGRDFGCYNWNEYFSTTITPRGLCNKTRRLLIIIIIIFIS